MSIRICIWRTGGSQNAGAFAPHPIAIPALPSLIHEVQATEQAVGLAVRPSGEIEEIRTSEARAVAKGEAPEAINLDGLLIMAA